MGGEGVPGDAERWAVCAFHGGRPADGGVSGVRWRGGVGRPGGGPGDGCAVCERERDGVDGRLAGEQGERRPWGGRVSIAVRGVPWDGYGWVAAGVSVAPGSGEAADGCADCGDDSCGKGPDAFAAESNGRAGGGGNPIYQGRTAGSGGGQEGAGCGNGGDGGCAGGESGGGEGVWAAVRALPWGSSGGSCAGVPHAGGGGAEDAGGADCGADSRRQGADAGDAAGAGGGTGCAAQVYGG